MAAMENRRFYLVGLWQVQAMRVRRVRASDAFTRFMDGPSMPPKLSTL
jgi:hypothetical protein